MPRKGQQFRDAVHHRLHPSADRPKNRPIGAGKCCCTQRGQRAGAVAALAVADFMELPSRIQCHLSMLQRFHTNRSRASRSLFGDVILEVLEIDAIAETELKKKQGNRGETHHRRRRVRLDAYETPGA